MGEIKLTISIVIYKSNLLLFDSLLNSIDSALYYLLIKLNRKISLCIDVINNLQNDPDENKLIYLILSKNNLDIYYIQTLKNIGYGAANNISILNHLESNFHLVLNPDIKLHDTTLLHGINFLLSRPDVGLLSPCVLDMDTNELQYLCKRNPLFVDMALRAIGLSCFANRDYLYEMRDYDYSKIIEPLPYPTGCFMLFDTKTLISVGCFDERYFLHYEDADIGRSINRISKVVYAPNVIVWHKWARDTHKSWRIRIITIISGIKYLIKWSYVKVT